MAMCMSLPCEHGTCIPMSNDYICMCEPGFEGKDCQIGKLITGYLFKILDKMNKCDTLVFCNYYFYLAALQPM